MIRSSDLPYVGRELGLAGDRSSRRLHLHGSRLGDRRQHSGRCIADAEQPALALGEHLELDGRLVEPGRELLELPKRLPLRLADGLAGRLDLELAAHRPPRGFFRFTRLGAAAA